MMIDLETLDLHNIKNKKIRAILVCLFTNAYVEPDELPEWIKNNQGWWGNEIEVLIGNKKEKVNWGSRFWTFDRAKMNEISESDAKAIITESLEILINAKVIKSLEVNIRKEKNRLNIILTVDSEVLDIRGF